MPAPAMAATADAIIVVTKKEVSVHVV